MNNLHRTIPSANWSAYIPYKHTSELDDDDDDDEYTLQSLGQNVDAIMYSCSHQVFIS